jgi:hypothetical protein
MDLIQAIKEIGFPAAAFVLMYQMNRATIAANTEALNQVKAALDEIRGLLSRAVNCPFVEDVKGMKDAR